MHRRHLLKLAALGGPLVVAGRAFAAPQTSTRLLVVFLRGAYDAANVLVPLTSSLYREARPTIAIARPDPANPDAALPLTADWGLHPALKETILPLWAKRQVAFVPFAGTDDLSRSHFETQDSICLGQPLNGPREANSGFMSRLASGLSGVQPIAFTDQLPLIMRGPGQIPNIGLMHPGRPVADRDKALIQSMYQGSDLSGAVSEGFEVQGEVLQSISQEMKAADRGAVSARGFELAARRIGRLMQGRFNLAFVDVGGWDTHVGQGGAQGYLAGRLGELGRGLAGFADEIGPADWNDTVVVVISEFGRTFHENGGKGTDHGHGTVYWVLGGRVAGGQVLGDEVKVEQASLNQGRDYPVLNEYRGVLGGLFQRVYGLPTGRLQSVFPQASPKDLRLV